MDFQLWLHNLATEPLPGGVSAAAVAATMGAALVAKTTRHTLRRESLDEASRAALENLLCLASGKLGTLMRLAEQDECAYRAVLDSRSSPTRREALLAATDTALRLAELCRSVLEVLSLLFDTCAPAVYPDLQTGRWLLETGLRAGSLAAQSNLRLAGDPPEAGDYQRRLDVLR